MAKLVPTGSNLRAGAEYRSHLARVLLKRNLEQLLEQRKEEPCDDDQTYTERRPVTAQIEDGMTLYEFVRSRGCCSVKCGCETSNCGLCTVFLNDLPVLSCSVLAAPGGRMQGGYSGGAAGRGGGVWRLYRDQGAEQCGFCNPGMVMNAIALFRENPVSHR